MTIEQEQTERQATEARLARAASAAKQAFMGHEPSEDDTVWARIALAVLGALLQAGEATTEQGRVLARRYGPEPHGSPDYLETFERFWRDIVGPLDALNSDQVARELHDFSHVMSEVPAVYGHVTGGAMSYTTYYAGDVCAQADAHYDRIAQEHGDERVVETLREVIDAWQLRADDHPTVHALLTDVNARIEHLEAAARKPRG